MNWFRIMTFYGLGRDADEAIASRELFGNGYPVTAIECSAEDVPYKTRAFQEAATEELRNALIRRGYKVVLK